MLSSRGLPSSVSQRTSGGGVPPTTQLMVLLVPTYAVTALGSVWQTGLIGAMKLIM